MRAASQYFPTTTSFRMVAANADASLSPVDWTVLALAIGRRDLTLRRTQLKRAPRLLAFSEVVQKGIPHALAKLLRRWSRLSTPPSSKGPIRLCHNLVPPSQISSNLAKALEVTGVKPYHDDPLFTF